MSGNTGFMAAVIVTLVATPSVVLAQNTPITGARFTLVEKTEPALSVTLENLRDSPLVAWEIGVHSNGSPGPRMVHSSDFTGFDVSDGPVAPRNQRVIQISTGHSVASAAVLRLAVFADGYYEGQPDAVDAFRQRRRQEADDLRYWIQTFNETPRGSMDAAVSFLRERLAQRASELQSTAHRSNVANNLWSLIVRSPPQDLRRLGSALDHRRVEAVRRLAALDRPLTTSDQRRPGEMFARITSAPTAHSVLNGLVENLRDVAIEAIGVERFSADGRVDGVISDYCGAAPTTPGHGLVAGGERRELFLSWIRNADGSIPQTRITFVIFEDLRFEGSATARNSLLEARERRAVEAAYWVDALKKAATQETEVAHEYLAERLRERSGAMAMASSPTIGHSREIEQLLEHSRKVPSEFAAMAASLAASLERQRVQLTRHLLR